MMFLTFSPYTSSKVYRFVDPDTSHLYEAQDKLTLMRHIQGYRTQNRLPPIEMLPQVIDNYLCQLPENCGACQHQVLHRSILSYVKGGIALLKHMYYGDENIVPQLTADARSKICIQCPNNIFPDKNQFLKWSDDVAIACVGDRKSKHHSELGNCKACSCPLRSKVWFKGNPSLSQAEIEDITRTAPNCWQLPQTHKE